jgi:hypothetical protein
VHASLEPFGMKVEFEVGQNEESCVETPGGFHPGFAEACLDSCAWLSST